MAWFRVEEGIGTKRWRLARAREIWMKVDVVFDAGAIIGESPTWVAAENALYWIDVKKPSLCRLDLDSNRHHSWSMPSDIGAFALASDLEGAIVALRDGIFDFQFASGALTLLAAAPFDRNLFRFNEGACDGAGRFWVGMMFDPLVPYDGTPLRSSLHCFTRDGGLCPEPDAAELHNGMAWSSDGQRFYLSHSHRREIFVFPFEIETGRLGQRKKFVHIQKNYGIPDGAAIDDQGGYWCALHGAGRLRRYTAEGVFDRDIPLPVSQPTMCAFGGRALDTLYVTSATDKLTGQQLLQEPLAGALLSLKPGERGIPRRPFIAD